MARLAYLYLSGVLVQGQGNGSTGYGQQYGGGYASRGYGQQYGGGYASTGYGQQYGGGYASTGYGQQYGPQGWAGFQDNEPSRIYTSGGFRRPPPRKFAGFGGDWGKPEEGYTTNWGNIGPEKRFTNYWTGPVQSFRTKTQESQPYAFVHKIVGKKTIFGKTQTRTKSHIVHLGARRTREFGPWNYAPIRQTKSDWRNVWDSGYGRGQLIDMRHRGGVRNPNPYRPRFSNPRAMNWNIDIGGQPGYISTPVYDPRWRSGGYSNDYNQDPRWRSGGYSNDYNQGYRPSYQEPSYQEPSYREPSYREPSYRPSYQEPSYFDQEPSYQYQEQEPSYQEPSYDDYYSDYQQEPKEQQTKTDYESDPVQEDVE